MPQERQTQDNDLLFSEVASGGPLEELEAIFQKKLLRCQSLGESKNAEGYRKAYELARSKLTSVLSASETGGS